MAASERASSSPEPVPVTSKAITIMQTPDTKVPKIDSFVLSLMAIYPPYHSLSLPERLDVI
jgi:hypothetical protein